MRFLAGLAFVPILLIPAIPVAEPLTATTENYPVAQIISGTDLALTDGRIVHLEGITEPFAETQKWQDASRQALQDLAAGKTILLEDDSTDRYGRAAAQVYVRDAGGDKIWLQGEMLRRGLAFIYPPTGNEGRLDEMRKLEAGARQNKTGIWADAAYADLAANKVAAEEGRFVFVSGAVLDTARVKNMIYLNFGPNWRTDFTIAIAAHDLRAFRDKNIDPLALKGKTIRIRGWVKRDFGPMITVTNPGQIEILGP